MLNSGIILNSEDIFLVGYLKGFLDFNDNDLSFSDFYGYLLGISKGYSC